MNNDPRRRAYFLEVAEALTQCQLLEIELKYYIAMVIRLKTTKPKATVPCTWTVEKMNKVKAELAEAPLGLLVKHFASSSDAPTLVTELATFKLKRNRLAHQLLAAAIDPDGELDYGQADRLTNEVEMIRDEARRLIDHVGEALVPIMVQEMFEDLTKTKQPEPEERA